MIPSDGVAFWVTVTSIVVFGTAVAVLESLQMELDELIIALPIYVFTFVLTLYTLLVTALTDPGFLPKLTTLRSLADDTPIEFLRQKDRITAINRMYMEAFSTDIDLSIPEEYVLYVHTNPPAGKKIYCCDTCGMFRPSKDTSHCRTCGKCVIGMDHHCGFLGTCIGARNRGNFLAFLSAAQVWLITSIAVCGWNIRNACIALDEIMTMPEWIMLGMTIGVGVFLVMFGACIFNHRTFSMLLFCEGVIGMATTIVFIVDRHFPISSGIFLFISISTLVFLFITWTTQIAVLTNGTTVRKMLKKADLSQPLMGGEIKWPRKGKKSAISGSDVAWMTLRGLSWKHKPIPSLYIPEPPLSSMIADKL
jgi:hypothetical protein